MKSLSDPKFSKKDMDKRIETLEALLEQHRRYVLWADMARAVVMSNLAPRVYALSQVWYIGCGYQYSMEKNLAYLIEKLSLSSKPCMNWVEKNLEESINREVTVILFEELCEHVVEAEQSALGESAKTWGRETRHGWSSAKVVRNKKKHVFTREDE